MLKNRQKPFIGFRPRQDVEDDEYEYPAQRELTIYVHPEDQREPEFTGILTSQGVPLYRYYPEKIPPGYLSAGLEYYDPDDFTYGEQLPDGSARMRDDLHPQIDEDDGGA